MNAAISLKLFEIMKELIKDEAKARELIAEIKEIFERKTEVLSTKKRYFRT